MSKLSERLEELLNDKNLKRKELAKNTNINATCISHYILEKRIPTIESLIKLADYFQCSTDFLLGLEEEKENLTFKQCPPFSEQIKLLKKQSGCSAKDFYNKAEIAKSTYYNWRNGKEPNLDNILHLAEKLDKRVDFILGRES